MKYKLKYTVYGHWTGLSHIDRQLATLKIQPMDNLPELCHFGHVLSFSDGMWEKTNYLKVFWTENYATLIKVTILSKFFKLFFHLIRYGPVLVRPN